MTEILNLSTRQVTPERTVVFEHLGIPPERAVSDSVAALYVSALDIFADLLAPAGKLQEVSRDEFADVYAGQGGNDAHTPVGEIYPQARWLALFAVTVGQAICDEITRRFADNDPALGCMLDSLASVGADLAAEQAEARYRQMLADTGDAGPDTGVLRYSPGYCGWHLSGQGKLFDHLSPGEVGIGLSDSFLMQPLKSVSGVILAGPKEIHEFEPAYSCCVGCATQECRTRIATLEIG
ncbi:MAG: hypothetical protein GY778_30490 [bacterium]|nr:hypothetical protein [bacterium]